MTTVGVSAELAVSVKDSVDVVGGREIGAKGRSYQLRVLTLQI